MGSGIQGIIGHRRCHLPCPPPDVCSGDLVIDSHDHEEVDSGGASVSMVSDGSIAGEPEGLQSTDIRQAATKAPALPYRTPVWRESSRAVLYSEKRHLYVLRLVTWFPCSCDILMYKPNTSSDVISPPEVQIVRTRSRRTQTQNYCKWWQRIPLVKKII